MSGRSARPIDAVGREPAPVPRSRVSHLAEWPRRLAITFATLYSAGIAVLAGLWVLAPGLHWMVGLTNLFAVCFFAPLALLMPLALIFRSRRMALAAALPLVIFITLFGDRFVPRRPLESVATTQLRVATLNLWRHNEEPERAIAAIRAQDSDVVALQEISTSKFTAVAQNLQDAYPYQALYHGERLGMLSRYPITSSGSLSSVRGHWITLSIGESAVAVVNVHIHRGELATRPLPGIDWLPIVHDYDSRMQQDQVTALLQELERAQLPYILAGDFNLSDRDPVYASLSAQLTDAFRTAETGFGYTYPSQKRISALNIPFPLLRIDYIWSVAEIRPRDALVDCSAGSDHCMLIADLLIGAGDD